MRPIDADAFLDRVLPECQCPELLKKAVDEQPTIERTCGTGRWIPVDGEPYAICSYCGEKHYGCTTPYCDMCGAYMRATEPEVRHGRWETWGYVFHGIEWKRCSCCGKCADVSYYGLLDGEIKMSTPAICGCCGARMGE